MKRKLVKTGENTHVVSLPIDWVRKNNLTKGDVLEIEEEGNTICILPGQKTTKKISLKFEEEEYWYIHRLLRKLYTSGYDQIEINYKKEMQISDIRKSMEYLQGFEIITIRDKYCVIKNMIPSDKTDYQQLIKDILWLIHSQLKIFYESQTKNRSLEEIKGINQTVTKLSHLGRRLLNLTEKQNISLLKDSFLLFTDLIYMSSYIDYASDNLLSEKKSLDKEEINLVKDTLEMYEDLLEACNNNRIALIYSFFEKRENSFGSDLKALEGKNPIAVHFIINFRKDLAGIGNYFMLKNFSDKL